MPETMDFLENGSRNDGKTAGRSNFSETCNLLSKYLKEKGGLGDLSLGLGVSKDSRERAECEGFQPTPVKDSNNSGTKSMDLFPQHVALEKASHTEEKVAKPHTAPQMTVFYAGKVHVFNDVTSGKATALMRFLEISSQTRDSRSSFTGSLLPEENLEPASSTNSSEIPVARKASLKRFLEKRKDRASSRFPYQYPTPEKQATVKLGSASSGLYDSMSAMSLGFSTGGVKAQSWVGNRLNSPNHPFNKSTHLAPPPKF